jgi:hypothetical protein
MSYNDLRLAEARREMRDEAALRLARSQTLLRQAGVQQPGWLARQGCGLVCRLGRLLVALGSRLERYAELRLGSVEPALSPRRVPERPPRVLRCPKGGLSTSSEGRTRSPVSTRAFSAGGMTTR